MGLVRCQQASLASTHSTAAATFLRPGGISAEHTEPHQALTQALKQGLSS